MRTILTTILLLNLTIVFSQDTITTTYRTAEILDFCKIKGGDSTLINYNCTYISLIDSHACMTIFNNIHGDYAKKPKLYSEQKASEEKKYAFEFYRYRDFVFNSGNIIRDDNILNKMIDLYYLDINDTLGKYVFEIHESELHPLIYQIKGTDRDTLLLHFAEKWLQRSQNFKSSKLTLFKRVIPGIFTGEYPRNYNNYIDCRLNEIAFLKAYSTCTDKNTHEIETRIKKTMEFLDEFSGGGDYYKSGIRPFSTNYITTDFEKDNYKTYVPMVEMNSLERFDFHDYINSQVESCFNNIYLTLICNDKKGILYSDVSFSVKKHGSAQNMVFYIELKDENKIYKKDVAGVYIN